MKQLILTLSLAVIALGLVAQNFSFSLQKEDGLTVGPEAEIIAKAVIGDSVFASATPNMNGTFTFSDLPDGTYRLVLESSNNDGVSTFSMVLISRHILGLQYLDSPYKILAADVNGTGTVTTLDLVEMRRVILGITDGFSGPSWQAYAPTFVFPDPTDPFGEDASAYITIPDDLPGFPGFLPVFLAVQAGNVNLD